MDLAEEGLELRDLLHLLHLLVTSLHDFLVLHFNHTSLHENRIFVVSGNGELRDLNLTLLKVDDNFKVILEFGYTIGCLFVESESFLEFSLDI